MFAHHEVLVHAAKQWNASRSVASVPPPIAVSPFEKGVNTDEERRNAQIQRHYMMRIADGSSNNDIMIGFFVGSEKSVCESSDGRTTID